MLSCLLLWLRHSSRQLLCPASRFVQSSFITLHYVAFAIQRTRSLRLGHLLNDFFVMFKRGFSQITTNYIHFHRKLIPLHFVSFSPLSLSRLQATRCPCCARLRCRSGCGLSCFLHNALLADTPPAPFNNQHTQAKKHASPCSVRASSLDTCPRCSHFLIVRTALIRSSFVLLAHTLPPARGLTSGRPLRSPLAARKTERGHRTANAHQVNSR
mgnify:CR=1 FL=1